MSELTAGQREIVLANIGLVEHIVRRLTAGLPATHTRDDLVQAGMLGLIGAATRFDPGRGAAFSTFAGRRIEGAIIDALRQSDWVPRSVRSLERRVRAVEDGVNGRADNYWDEVGQSLGLDLEQVRQLRRDLARCRMDSLDRTVQIDGENLLPLAATIADHAASIEEQLSNAEARDLLRRGLGRLGERHRIVIHGYFFEGRTMTELGELLGISQPRASKLKEEALRILRSELVTS
ncbi:MAG: sigma-70 family RNA polymerase sigma factor [Actinomycetota bacterium]